jgi:pimeloyl-ACP methyl ester carboxylesterase
VAQGFYEVFVTDVRLALPSLHVPTVVIYASSPLLAAPPEAIDTFYRQVYAGLAGVQLKRIDNSRHFVMFDQPAAFLAALDAALK